MKLYDYARMTPAQQATALQKLRTPEAIQASQRSLRARVERLEEAYGISTATMRALYKANPVEYDTYDFNHWRILADLLDR